MESKKLREDAKKKFLINILKVARKEKQCSKDNRYMLSSLFQELL